MNIRNFFAPNFRIGTAGQPERDEFKPIAQEGYKVVINLAMHDSTYAISDEGNLVTREGMNYFHLPIPFETPTRDQLMQFIALMKIYRNEKVFVHCALNLRASVFTHRYLTLVEHLDSESATSPFLRDWDITPPWAVLMHLNKSDLPID